MSNIVYAAHRPFHDEDAGRDQLDRLRPDELGEYVGRHRADMVDPDGSDFAYAVSDPHAHIVRDSWSLPEGFRTGPYLSPRNRQLISVVHRGRYAAHCLYWLPESSSGYEGRHAAQVTS